MVRLLESSLKGIERDGEGRERETWGRLGSEIVVNVDRRFRDDRQAAKSIMNCQALFKLQRNVSGQGSHSISTGIFLMQTIIQPLNGITGPTATWLDVPRLRSEIIVNN